MHHSQNLCQKLVSENVSQARFSWLNHDGDSILLMWYTNNYSQITGQNLLFFEAYSSLTAHQIGRPKINSFVHSFDVLINEFLPSAPNGTASRLRRTPWRSEKYRSQFFLHGLPQDAAGPQTPARVGLGGVSYWWAMVTMASAHRRPMVRPRVCAVPHGGSAFAITLVRICLDLIWSTKQYFHGKSLHGLPQDAAGPQRLLSANRSTLT